MSTDLDLASLRAALEKMTPGPWRARESEADFDPRQAGWWTVFAGVDTSVADAYRHRGNALGVVALVNAAPALLDRITHLGDALAEALELAEHAISHELDARLHLDERADYRAGVKREAAALRDIVEGLRSLLHGSSTPVQGGGG